MQLKKKSKGEGRRKSGEGLEEENWELAKCEKLRTSKKEKITEKKMLRRREGQFKAEEIV